MDQDRCNTGGSFLGCNCTWIIIIVIIFIILTCCCNNKKETDDCCYQDYTF